MNRRLGLAAVLVLLVAAGLIWVTRAHEGVPPAAAASPFQPCPAPPATGAPAMGSPAPGSAAPDSAAPDSARDLPRVVLPCFTGGEPIELAALGRPAVVNLWASWCRPCRAELPVFQAFADKYGPDVEVIGVVTADPRPAATGLAEDLHIDFPALFDPKERLRLALGVAALPLTLLVDAQGRVRHVIAATVPDLSTLESLTHEHLGVALR